MSKGPLRQIVGKLKEVFRRVNRKQPQDPYAHVTTSRKPRPSSRAAATVADIEQ